MSDLFPILPPEPAAPRRFEDAVREAVEQIEGALREFDALLDGVTEAQFTAEEWRFIERTADEVEKAAEMAEDGYVAVAFDGHAWYRIVENLERVGERLDSAVNMMRAARDRAGGAEETGK